MMTLDQMQKEAERLLALDSKRTPGPVTLENTANPGDYGSGPNPASGFDSFAVVDDQGRVLFDTLNRDWQLSEVHEEMDEDGRHAWDELARRDMRFYAAAPAMAALIAAQSQALERMGAEVERLRADKERMGCGSNPLHAPSA